MDEFLLKLKIIEDLLENKKVQLNNILNITLNQREILLYPNNDTSDFFLLMNKEKQNCIDEVIKIDNVFQSTFEKTKDELNKKSHLYKDKILQLQSLIKEVTDLDIKIKIQEDKNKSLLKKPSTWENKNKLRKEEFILKASLLKKYKDNSNLKSHKHKKNIII